ncbi:hypothetical protein PanWU01x14_272540, partial [Parasponia andersonii]
MNEFVNIWEDGIDMESCSDDEDELRSTCESDSEEFEGANPRRRRTEFNPQIDIQNPSFKIGILFPSKDDFIKDSYKG